MKWNKAHALCLCHEWIRNRINKKFMMSNIALVVFIPCCTRDLSILKNLNHGWKVKNLQLASLLRRALYPQYEFYFKQMARSKIGQTNWNFDFDFDSDGLFGNADEPDPYCSVLKKNGVIHLLFCRVHRNCFELRTCHTSKKRCMNLMWRNGILNCSMHVNDHFFPCNGPDFT